MTGAKGSLAVMSDGGCCAPSPKTSVHEGLASLVRAYDVNEFAASVQVYALKP